MRAETERDDLQPDVEAEVYLYEDAQSWFVVAAGQRQQFDSRSVALRAARDAARQHAPSRVILDRPDGEPPTATPPRAEPLEAVADAPEVARPEGADDWDQLAGPLALGRSLLVISGGSLPAPWSGSERIAVSRSQLDDAGFLRRVRGAYLERRRVVYELDADLTQPELASFEGEVFDAPIDHDFVAEDTWELMTRNSVDARPGTPSWPLAEQAVRAGAAHGTHADIVSDGGHAWCDGGPLRLWGQAEIKGLGAAIISREAIELGSLSALTPRALDAELAPDQLEAVADPELRARIIAPAGSGKTRVLTERARHLLGSGIPSPALLLVAFNKRAQIEIVERTGDLPRLQVQTLNALALAILNGTNGFTHAGAGVRTIDERQVRDLIGELVTFPRRANTDPASSWIDALSMVRLGLRSPVDVEAEFNGDVDGFADVFPLYRRQLRSRGVVDFDEQIYRALELLLTEPEIRGKAQRRARALLVDELQDLTPAHMLMLRVLAGPALGIFGVGDDDQTIYGYSGASPRWLVSFDDYVPNASHHGLTVNYRCPAPVIAGARNLLSRNEFRVAKEIHEGAHNGAEPIATVLHEIPVVATLDLIREHLARGARPSEIAVLTRVNTLLAPIQAALKDAGIPVQNRDGTRFLQRSGVDAALSWFRLAVAPDRLSGADLTRAARRPSRGIAPRVTEWIGDQQDVAGIERLADRISDERASEKVRTFATDVARARDLGRTASSAELLEFIRTKTGLDRSLQALDAAHRGRNSAAHSDDLRALVALGHLHPKTATFVQWLGNALEADSAQSGVVLATVHKVKGLEWPHVIVYDATSGVFPHRLSTDIEEERRVFHVAITRAQRSLQIVADAANPSMFIDELASPGEPPKRSDDGGGGRSATTRDSRGRRDAVSSPASAGMEFSWGGYDCTVTSVTDEGAVVAVGSATMTIPFGSEMVIEGSSATLGPPKRGKARSASTSSSDADPEVVAALKGWRLERCRRDGVPAYVVLHNKTIDLIAEEMPATEVDLLSISGMGPTRVQTYGDEILAVLDAART